MVSSDRERKTEYQGREHANDGLKPKTFSLWGNTANHRVIIPVIKHLLLQHKSSDKSFV